MKKIKHIRLNNTDYRIDGDSAYEVAVANGFTGTEQEWLDSLTDGAITQAAGHAANAAVYRERAETACLAAEEARAAAEGHTADQIRAWLDVHPEATTTVQDRSLTIGKMVVGSLGYVTPEQFGAKGDGVTDDTKAFQDCVNAELPICARKTYFITDQIGCANKSLDLFGGGTFIAASQDNISALFYVSDQKGGEPVDHVTVKDMSFRSVRDNTNIFPPAGHTREEGCLASNVHCLMLANIKNVVLENLRFENMEYDVFFADCESINSRGHYSTGASMGYYGRGCGNFQIRDAKITLYDKVGVGDHHFYFGKNNGDVLIENVRLYSTTDKSGYYPIHFYSDEGYSAINVTVRNSYIEHANAICAICQNGIVVENTTFVNIIGGTKDGTFVYEATSNESITHRFKGCAFKSLNGKLNVINFTNKAVFADCVFEGADINLVLEAKANVSFERCGFAFNGRLYVYSNVRYTFTDCAFKMNNWCVFVESGRSPSCDFTRCSFEANADGIFSVRSASTVTLIDCNGTNEQSAKKFNYDGGNTAATYKLYHCTFPDLTFYSSGQTLVEKLTVWANS
jgi:hypothetical protein